MKKTFLTIIAAVIVTCGYSQVRMGDYALLFSENEYEGTARTMAMGNAFTALGGDLGSIGLNPAGSAVAGYSQITFTPGLTFSATTSKGVSPYSDGELPYFERQMKSRMTNFALPNIGVVLNYNTQRTSGLKNITLGFVANKTASWDEDVYANGTNNTTSFMGSMAFWSTFDGFTGTDFNASDAYDFMPWKETVAYRSGMISTFGGHDNQFVGASEVITQDENTKEDIIFLGGALNQSYGRKVKGAKYDYVLNIGANISDFIYIGANLGMTTIDYGYNDYFKETAVDPYLFEIAFRNNDDTETLTYFNDMRYKYSYNASGFGYYGKFGLIVTPGMGLRIGAAIQTPTITAITEEWKHSGETTYLNGSYNASESSPRGEDSYKIVSPYRANFGIAYTLGKFAVVSADYEICDYSRMRFKTSDDYSRDYFETVNDEIREDFRAAHSFRAGAEVKPLSGLAVRVGYGFTTSPENYIYELDEVSVLKVQNLSFGIGYSSKKSFFADLAVRRTFLPDEYYMPYSDYIFEIDENGDYLVDSKGNFVVAPKSYAPELLNRKSLWKVALTLGWRF